MRIHVLQHVSFEDEAGIGVWAKAQDHSITKTLLYRNEKLPPTDNFDRLLIMGGPMSVHDEREYPWLVGEKKLIREAIEKGKTVLGVCLGAQLIAHVLAARVYKNPHKEIGWHGVSLAKEAGRSPVFNRFPKKFTAFHWHGETFDLPLGCARIAESEACLNQAFEYDGRVVGLQFHLESSEESIRRLIQNCPEDLADGKYVQRADEILAGADEFLEPMRGLMTQVLDKI
jgi:GMP synthase-like glutamine amidotransferase